MTGLSLRLILAVLVLVASTAVAQTTSRPGVPPQDAWTCPLTHPIKGLENFAQAFQTLETAREAIKVYYEVAELN